MPALGLASRPHEIGMLQAVAAVGQPRLMAHLSELFVPHGIVAGQVLLTPHDFGVRTQYLHARETLRRLLHLGVVPVVNENDTVAALVSHLVEADLLLLLTDTEGLFTADPRRDAEASLIEEIVEVDAALEAVAGGAGSDRGSGGMASKLAAAKIAAWSGVRVVIAGADTPGVMAAARQGRSVGTAFRPRADRLPSRKLWIAFARGAAGRIVVDDGARRALTSDGRSLLAAGVLEVEGEFEADDAVEIVDGSGTPFAKGIVTLPAATLREVAGRRTAELPEGMVHEVIHRDDLVVLP
jgi:glutamate 5-kinase